MNKEAYVTDKAAQLLKEKGFTWRVFNFYDEHGIFSEHIGSVYSLYNWNYPTKDEYGSQYCSAPTQQMAIRCLMRSAALKKYLTFGQNAFVSLHTSSLSSSKLIGTSCQKNSKTSF